MLPSAVNACDGASASSNGAVALAPIQNWEVSLSSAMARHDKQHTPAPASLIEWVVPPMSEWPAGWMPHHGKQRYYQLKAEEDREQKEAAAQLARELEANPAIQQEMNTVVASSSPPRFNTSDVLFMHDILNDKRFNEAQQRASRERRKELAEKNPQLPRHEQDAALEEQEKKLATKMKKAALQAVAAEPPPPKIICATATPVSNALGKRKVVEATPVQAPPQPQQPPSDPPKKRGRKKKERPKMVPPPQPVLRSAWKLAQDQVSLKLGICDEKDLLDRLHSLDPSREKTALIPYVQGFKSILAVFHTEFNDFKSLHAWCKDGAEQCSVAETARTLYGLMYPHLADQPAAETAHIREAVESWAGELGGGEGVGLLGKLCALEA